MPKGSLCAKVRGMATLTEHLAASGLTQRQFAAELGISTSYLSEMVSGLKRPSLSLALRIERETGGAVTVHELASSDGSGDAR